MSNSQLRLLKKSLFTFSLWLLNLNLLLLLFFFWRSFKNYFVPTLNYDNKINLVLKLSNKLK